MYGRCYGLSFFLNFWEAFDFVVVIISIVGVILTQIPAVGFLRMLRIGRLPRPSKKIFVLQLSHHDHYCFLRRFSSRYFLLLSTSRIPWTDQFPHLCVRVSVCVCACICVCIDAVQNLAHASVAIGYISNLFRERERERGMDQDR